MKVSLSQIHWLTPQQIDEARNQRIIDELSQRQQRITRRRPKFDQPKKETHAK